MELELANKIFLLKDYCDRNDMEEHIKAYIRKLKNDYPMAVITREFYKGCNILVRATQINVQLKKENKTIEQDLELEQEEIRIKEKGINGLGENVYREKSNSRSRGFGHNGGNERERGGR